MSVGIDIIASARSEQKEKEQQNRIIQGVEAQFAKTVRSPLNAHT